MKDSIGIAIIKALQSGVTGGNAKALWIFGRLPELA
jgi:hypothetical protein